MEALEEGVKEEKGRSSVRPFKEGEGRAVGVGSMGERLRVFEVV